MTATTLEALVIGGSAGAVEALAVLLPTLPGAYRLPIAIVVHLGADRPSLFADVFGAKTALRVKDAEDKEPLVAGTIYVAPPGYHLLIEQDHTLALSVDEPLRFSRPSIDVLFESAAEAYGPHLAAVLLSGANDDGARGLAAIKRRGGLTIVQSPEDALAPTMPAAAMAVATPDHVLPLRDLAALLATLHETTPGGRPR